MSPSSSILYAFVNIGLGRQGAAYFLARQVGYAKAFEIAAEGKKSLLMNVFLWINQ